MKPLNTFYCERSGELTTLNRLKAMRFKEKSVSFKQSVIRSDSSAPKDSSHIVALKSGDIHLCSERDLNLRSLRPCCHQTLAGCYHQKRVIKSKVILRTHYK